MQGSIDYSLSLDEASSFYAGVWGSNVDFNDGDEANIELDWYAGLKHTVDHWTLDGNFTYYSYPGADSDLNYDYWEATAKVGYDFEVVNIAGSVSYSPDFFASSGDAWYTKLAATVPLPNDFSLDGSVGHQSVDDNAAFLFPDYNDWSVGVGYSFKGLGLKLSYIDTDMDRGECADGCEARVVFSVSKAL